MGIRFAWIALADAARDWHQFLPGCIAEAIHQPANVGVRAMAAAIVDVMHDKHRDSNPLQLQGGHGKFLGVAENGRSKYQSVRSIWSGEIAGGVCSGLRSTARSNEPNRHVGL